jgi:hypothetical protein
MEISMMYTELRITDQDVMAVIEARGGAAYPGSIATGLANRFPFVNQHLRERAVRQAVSRGMVVPTALGQLKLGTLAGE